MNNEQTQLLIAARRNIKECIKKLKAENPKPDYNESVLIDELNEMQYDIKIIVNMDSYNKSMRGQLK